MPGSEGYSSNETGRGVRMLVDHPRHLPPPPYTGELHTERTDAATVERWVGRLTRVVEADRLRRSPAYHLRGLGVSGPLADQVLRALEDAE